MVGANYYPSFFLCFVGAGIPTDAPWYTSIETRRFAFSSPHLIQYYIFIARQLENHSIHFVIISRNIDRKRVNCEEDNLFHLAKRGFDGGNGRGWVYRILGIKWGRANRYWDSTSK
jgi:hypothetical protein